MVAYIIEVTFFDFEVNDFVRRSVLTLSNDVKEVERQMIQSGYAIRYFHKDKKTALQKNIPVYLIAGDSLIDDSYESTFRFITQPKEITFPHVFI